MFEYNMVQIPPTISVESGTKSAAANYLGNIVGSNAALGWEFYSIESIGIVEHMGCCGCLSFIFTMFGMKTSSERTVYVIVFRRPRVQLQPGPPPPGSFQA